MQVDKDSTYVSRLLNNIEIKNQLFGTINYYNVLRI